MINIQMHKKLDILTNNVVPHQSLVFIGIVDTTK